jgi:hypothetical protein
LASFRQIVLAVLGQNDLVLTGFSKKSVPKTLPILIEKRAMIKNDMSYAHKYAPLWRAKVGSLMLRKCSGSSLEDCSEGCARHQRLLFRDCPAPVQSLFINCSKVVTVTT